MMGGGYFSGRKLHRGLNDCFWQKIFNGSGQVCIFTSSPSVVPPVHLCTPAHPMAVTQSEQAPLPLCRAAPFCSIVRSTHVRDGFSAVDAGQLRPAQARPRVVQLRRRRAAGVAAGPAGQRAAGCAGTPHGNDAGAAADRAAVRWQVGASAHGVPPGTSPPRSRAWGGREVGWLIEQVINSGEPLTQQLRGRPR